MASLNGLTGAVTQSDVDASVAGIVIDTDQIKDSAVTNSKIHAASVTNSKIASTAVTHSKCKFFGAKANLIVGGDVQTHTSVGAENFTGIDLPMTGDVTLALAGSSGSRTGIEATIADNAVTADKLANDIAVTTTGTIDAAKLSVSGPSSVSSDLELLNANNRLTVTQLSAGGSEMKLQSGAAHDFVTFTVDGDSLDIVGGGMENGLLLNLGAAVNVTGNLTASGTVSDSQGTLASQSALDTTNSNVETMRGSAPYAEKANKSGSGVTDSFFTGSSLGFVPVNYGITDGAAVKVDGTITQGQLARWTANGLESHAAAISDNNFTDALLTKLNGIEDNADVTDLTNVSAALSGQDLSVARVLTTGSFPSIIGLVGSVAYDSAGNYTVTGPRVGANSNENMLLAYRYNVTGGTSVGIIDVGGHAAGDTTGDGLSIRFGGTEKYLLDNNGNMTVHGNLACGTIDANGNFNASATVNANGNLHIYRVFADLAYRFNGDGFDILIKSGSERNLQNITNATITNQLTCGKLTLQEASDATNTAGLVNFRNTHFDYPAGSANSSNFITSKGSGSTVIRNDAGNAFVVSGTIITIAEPVNMGSNSLTCTGITSNGVLGSNNGDLRVNNYNNTRLFEITDTGSSGVRVRTNGDIQLFSSSVTGTPSIDFDHFLGKGTFQHVLALQEVRSGTDPGAQVILDPDDGGHVAVRFSRRLVSTDSTNTRIGTIQIRYHGWGYYQSGSAGPTGYGLQGWAAYQFYSANISAVLNNSSDSRLKTNVVSADTQSCYNAVKNTRLAQYSYIPTYGTWLGKSNRTVSGWIADEVQETIPSAVTIVDDLDHPLYDQIAADFPDKQTTFGAGNGIKQIDQSAMIKQLWGAVQVLMARVETLETQLVATREIANTNKRSFDQMSSSSSSSSVSSSDISSSSSSSS